MSIATVVTRGFGSFGIVSFVPTLGYGDYARPNIGPGRLEYTIPRMLTQYATPNHRTQFTLPRVAEQYTEPTP